MHILILVLKFVKLSWENLNIEHTNTIHIPSISVKNFNKILLLWNGLEILVWKYLMHSWIQINILLEAWSLSSSFLETHNWILLLYFQGSFFGYVLPVLVFSAFYNIPKFFEFSTSYNPGWVCRKYEFYFASFQGFRIRIGSHFHWLVTALFCICLLLQFIGANFEGDRLQEKCGLQLLCSRVQLHLYG